MSVQIKTPPTHSTFDASDSKCGQPSHNTADSGKKRRQSHHPPDDHSNFHKRRRYSASKMNRIFENHIKSYRGGTLSDPLNLSGLENRTGPSPAPSPDAYLQRISARKHPPKISNITDPLNLTVDDATGEIIGPLSPTGPIRQRRKRLSKKILQKLEIDFDSDNEVEADGSVTQPQLSADADTAERLSDPLNLTSPGESSSAGTATSLGAAAVSAEVSQIKESADKNSLRLKSSASLDTHGARIPSNQTGAVNNRVKSEASSTVTSSTPDKPSRCKSADAQHSKPASLHRQKSVHKQKHKPPAKPVQREQRTKPSASKNCFIHGNYNRYYGYRSVDKMEVDPRVQALKPSWFSNKAVLDIGCNIGHVTLTVARDFTPSKVVGVDIDSKLISIARKNVRYYQDQQNYIKFPKSCTATYGPISVTDAVSAHPSAENEAQTSRGATSFPQNVSFIHGNYCLESDSFLEMVSAEFDVILALSVTKWMHLNNGDAGLKRCFKRMYLQLRPGGVLILEPQMWPSYKKKKTLSDTIKKNFEEIIFKPDQFTEYLLSSDVGFNTCERLNVQEHQSKGFRRPLLIFRKAAR